MKYLILIICILFSFEAKPQKDSIDLTLPVISTTYSAKIDSMSTINSKIIKKTNLRKKAIDVNLFFANITWVIVSFFLIRR